MRYEKKVYFLVLAFLVNASCFCENIVRINYLFYELNEENHTATVDSVVRMNGGDNFFYIYEFETNGIQIPSEIYYEGVTYTVTSIGDKALYSSSVGAVTIPETVTSIGNYAFCHCANMASITIPNSVTSIGNGAFQSCSKILSINIPESITTIGYYTFSGCSSLTSIIIPENVTSIGEYAFSGCSSITSITIPEGVTSIEVGTFGGCRKLTSIIIPENVTNIGKNAFTNCSSLISITIPEGVAEINRDTFRGCSGLTSITLPKGLTNIGVCAFQDCTSLTSITIPESVTYIDHYAFNRAGLESIRCDAVVPPTLGVYEPFSNTKIPLYVPAQSIELYKKANVWREFNILPIDEVISSIDEVRTTAKYKKIIRNGQVLIESGNKIYNTNGVEIR